MTPLPTGPSAFTSSLANANTLTTFVTWLEDELCAERQALGFALQDRHQALLSEVIRRLQAAAMDSRIQLPHCMSIHPAACAAGNPNLKRVCVSEASMNVPICSRHHAPPPEPSSPSSSFLGEDLVPENGHPALSTYENAGSDDTQELDEHVVQTSAVNDANDEITQNLADRTLCSLISDESHIPCGQTTSQSQGSLVDDSMVESKRTRPLTKKSLTGQFDAHKSSLEKARSRGMWWLARIVLSEHFEVTFAVLIVLNTIIMAAEAQYRGIESGFVLGYDRHLRSAQDIWPGAAIAFNILDWTFGVLFTLQLVLRMLSLCHEYFCEVWNIIDIVIVGAWLFSVLTSDELLLDPMILRLARLARLLRLLALVRTVKLFDALYLMTTSIKASLSALTWSIVLLVLFLVMMALLLQKLAEPYVLDDVNPLDKRMEVFMFYGTFGRSMLTMFEITLGNWMPPCRALVEHVSEWFMLIFLAHKLVIGFSVVSVINAVFVQETFKVATSDTRIMLMTKERARRTHLAKVQDLFQHVDEDGSGGLTASEFREAFSDPEVRKYVAALDLEIHDTDRLYHMIDVDSDGMVSLQELSEGMSRLRGAAKNSDVQVVLSHFRDIEDLLMRLNHALASDMSCSTLTVP